MAELSAYSLALTSAQEARERDERKPKSHRVLCDGSTHVFQSLNGDCLNWNAVQAAMRNARKGDKFQGEEPRKMTLKIQHGNRATVVV